MSHSVALMYWCLLDPVHQCVWEMENGNQTLAKSNAMVRPCINMYMYTHIHCVEYCGVPFILSDHTITIVYNSTLEGSILEFCCRESLLPSDVNTAVYSPDGMWIPDPNMHMCKSTISSGIV